MPRLRKLFVLVCLPAIASQPLHAACSARSTAERPHLVELYTAEGCSSCPPAERWMSSLRTSKTYIGLEFHVDYFDVQGWRDPFADPRYTARQQAIAKRAGRNVRFDKNAGIVYTPEVVVDGQVWKNWPKAAPPDVSSAQAPALSLDVALATTLQVNVAYAAEATPPADLRLYLALTENGLSSSVKAGENRGKRLDHDMVVRDLTDPLPLPQAKAELKLPEGFDPARSAVVAFVENTKSGEVMQALRLPLNECAFH